MQQRKMDCCFMLLPYHHAKEINLFGIILVYMIVFKTQRLYKPIALYATIRLRYTHDIL